MEVIISPKLGQNIKLGLFLFHTYMKSKFHISYQLGTTGGWRRHRLTEVQLFWSHHFQSCSGSQQVGKMIARAEETLNTSCDQGSVVTQPSSNVRGTGKCKYKLIGSERKGHKPVKSKPVFITKDFKIHVWAFSQ